MQRPAPNCDKEIGSHESIFISNDGEITPQPRTLVPLSPAIENMQAKDYLAAENNFKPRAK
jgi:hypothetical protein